MRKLKGNNLSTMLFTFHFRLKMKYYYLKTQLWYKPFFKNCGKRNLIIKPLLITPEFIKLSNNIFIRNNARIEGISEYAGVKFTPQIIIEEYVSIEQNIHLTCAKEIIIGKNTAIAANVSITDINHPYKDISISIEKQVIEANSVSIGEDCKIYNNSVILPGTKIGRHCTIGANSVVSGQFPDFCVIVGAPATIMKRYSFEKQAWLKTDKEGNFIEL